MTMTPPTAPPQPPHHDRQQQQTPKTTTRRKEEQNKRRDLARVYARLHPEQPPPSLLIAPAHQKKTWLQRALLPPSPFTTRRGDVAKKARRAAKKARRTARGQQQALIDAAFRAFERDATAWPTPRDHDFITAALDADVLRHELCDTRALFVELRAWSLAAAARATPPTAAVALDART
jgi:hypothetical protein